MQKATTLFAAAYAVLILVTAGLTIAFSDNASVAPFFSLGMGILVFGLAFVCHRVSGSVGNPFNGLVLGGFGPLALAWIGGILAGLLSVGLAIGLGFVQIDPDMNMFLAMSAEQASKGGNAVSMDQMKAAKGFIEIATLVGAVIGPFFLAPLISLSFFPVYGWWGRRLLTGGLSKAFFVLAVFGAVGTLVSIFIPNPMFDERNLALAIPIGMIYGVALTAVSLWLFLMTNSVIVPSLAFASMNGIFQATAMYYANPQAHMIPAIGAADLIVLVIIAVAMWSFKVPDWKRMEVAGVAFDGTSLTSAQIEQLEQRRTAAVAQSTGSTAAPPPQEVLDSEDAADSAEPAESDKPADADNKDN